MACPGDLADIAPLGYLPKPASLPESPPGRCDVAGLVWRLAAFFPTWPVSRPRWRSSPAAACVGRLSANEATWRAYAPTCGLAVRIGFLQLGDARLFGSRQFARHAAGCVRLPRVSMASRHAAKLPRTAADSLRTPISRLARVCEFKCNDNLPTVFETVATSPVELAF